MWLAAGHRDRIVVQNLVGDVDLGRHTRAHGQQTGVVVRAVTQVRENVLLIGERGLPDPRYALAAHLREGARAIHPHRHVVATDARNRTRALGHVGAGVVRTAGAEIRCACDGDDVPGQRTFLLVDPVDALLDAVTHVELGDTARDHPCNHRRCQLRRRRQQPVAMRAHPFALGVEFAHDLRTHILLPVVELLFQLIFEHLPFLFNDQNLLKARGEFMHAFRLQRPHHADLVNTQANGAGQLVVDAQIFKRLPHVEVGLARSHDAQTRTRRVDHDVI